MINIKFWLTPTASNRTLIKAAILLTAIVTETLIAQGHPSSLHKQNWTWNVFGRGFLGGSAVKRENEIFIDANWQKASWGLGISYVLELPESTKKLNRIQVQIRSILGSRAKVFIGLSKKTQGYAIQSPDIAQTITNEWQTFEFSTTQTSSRPTDALFDTSGNVKDSKVSQIFNLYFRKPEDSGSPTDTIVVRNLVLTFGNGESYAYQSLD